MLNRLSDTLITAGATMLIAGVAYKAIRLVNARRH